MIFKRFALPAALAASAAAAIAQAPPSDFAPERFRAHVAFLADDLLEGRETGTRGYDIAARYVAAQYEALGLTAGGPQGSWYQQVPFVRFAMTAPARITVAGRSFAHGEGLMVRQHPAAGRTQFEAPAVFAGWGLEAPGLGLDDYRGLDVRGKVVVVLNGTPPGLPSDVAAHLNSEKRRIAARHGAVGLIMLRRPTEARRPEHATARTSEPGIAWVERNGTPGVDRDEGRAGEPLAERSERFAVGDQGMDVHRARPIARPIALTKRVCAGGGCGGRNGSTRPEGTLLPRRVS
jgi:hypothetical protein